MDLEDGNKVIVDSTKVKFVGENDNFIWVLETLNRPNEFVIKSLMVRYLAKEDEKGKNSHMLRISNIVCRSVSTEI